MTWFDSHRRLLKLNFTMMRREWSPSFEGHCFARAVGTFTQAIANQFGIDSGENSIYKIGVQGDKMMVT